MQKPARTSEKGQSEMVEINRTKIRKTCELYVRGWWQYPTMVRDAWVDAIENQLLDNLVGYIPAIFNKTTSSMFLELADYEEEAGDSLLVILEKLNNLAKDRGLI